MRTLLVVAALGLLGAASAPFICSAASQPFEIVPDSVASDIRGGNCGDGTASCLSMKSFATTVCQTRSGIGDPRCPGSSDALQSSCAKEDTTQASTKRKFQDKAYCIIDNRCDSNPCDIYYQNAIGCSGEYAGS